MTRRASRTILLCAGFTQRSSLVLNESACQLAATRVAREAIWMPVLAVCCENRFRDNIVAAIAAVPIHAIRMKGTTLLYNVLVGDAAPALGTRHHVADTVRTVRLPTVVIEWPTKLHTAPRAIKMVWMPALAKSG